MASVWYSHDLHRGLTLTQLVHAFDPLRGRELITLCSFDLISKETEAGGAEL